ncbi:hypothetical protein NFC73_08965 [Pseudarthrobacter sp. RMG13]|uniref:Uncharacterized protein n=1 Tax=Pseudarthrobacter humi TaxID=2952523 RepID=A0ABT1LN47_9MICC|nr:hypothetical protein [Pseudarthrobacter humi]MCP8999860.1 hypothetical protein [Pseudarthrobacter humi]
MAFGPNAALSSEEIRATASVAFALGLLRGIAAFIPAGKVRLVRVVLPLIVLGTPLVLRGNDIYFHSAFPAWWVICPALVLVVGLVGQDLLTHIGDDRVAR